MTEKTILSADLISAYKATNFHVNAEPAFTLNVGKLSKELKDLFKLTRFSSAAFITAWNPYSKSLTKDENRSRNEMLKSELTLRSLEFLEGFGQDPAGQWAGEDSFLVLGISLEAAKKLGNQFEQNAIVWSESDAVPKLILLR